ncbi:MAG: glutaredoxin [Janthinobacterium sp.]|jgi:glutaredoxin
MHSTLKFALLLCLCIGAANAQVYRWKDAKGVTHFSDTPPAASVTVDKIDSRGPPEPQATSGLPFEVALAVKNHPVTLYTTSQCDACDQGRMMLQARGIPYVEKTVSNASDHAALRQAGGASQFPLLLIGSSKYVGFEQSRWDLALTAARYPVKNMLRSDYQSPPPAAAALPSAQPGTMAPAEDAGRQSLPPPRAAPNFQF